MLIVSGFLCTLNRKAPPNLYFTVWQHILSRTVSCCEYTCEQKLQKSLVYFCQTRVVEGVEGGVQRMQSR